MPCVEKKCIIYDTTDFKHKGIQFCHTSCKMFYKKIPTGGKGAEMLRYATINN